MNPTHRARLLDDLLTERRTLARRWYEALHTPEPTLDEARIQLLFLHRTEKLLALLLGEPFDVEGVQAFGNDLAKSDSIWEKPQALVRTQEVLARFLGEVLSAEEIALLQPRLARFYGELATGFFEKKVLLSHQMRRLVSCFSHELRTPLNAMICWSTLLLEEFDGPLTEVQQKYLTTLNHSGRYGLTLLDSLCTHKGIELRWEVLFQEEITIQNLVSSFRLPKLLQGRLVVEVLCKDNDLLHGDQERIEQLMQNLLEYILRHRKADSIIRLLVTREAMEGTEWLLFKIISPDPFHKLELHQQLFAQGMQLEDEIFWESDFSLSLSHRLARMMGGRIEVESEAEGGSICTFYLPTSPPA